MKKFFFGLLLAVSSIISCYAADAKFKIEDTTFVYTVREGAITYDLVVLLDNNDIYQGWTDGPDNKSIIAEDFDDAAIMAKGGRRAFIEWGLNEAIRRAQAHMTFLKPAVPDQNLYKMENTVWQIRYNLSSFPIIIPPAPLP